MIPRARFLVFVATVTAVASVFACGGGEKAPEQAPPATRPGVPSPAIGAPLTPEPGGRVHRIEMITDEQGVNKFVPATLEAHRGDVLRFTLVTGVHSVSFLPDSNPGASGLPPASALLQLPGQTHDIAVSFKPGHYYFQCDPHALLGMKGRLEVEERNE
jgi:plastocyanin